LPRPPPAFYSLAPLPRTLIVVPTYNERDNVADIARGMLEHGGAPLPPASTAGLAPAPAAAVAPQLELLFVDDNSPDGTGEELDRMNAADPRIHVLHRAGKLGLGTAYVEGFRWGLAQGFDVIIQMDADGSHDPRYLPQLLAELARGADLVVGSRYVPGGGTANWGLGRRLLSRGGGFYARRVLGVSVRDMTAGFACWTRAALEAIDLGSISSNGYSFQIEMKYRALRRKLTLVEVPIVFTDRKVGQSKMSRGIVLEAVAKVWRLRFFG
jgi:dolichol-phosphate mannosyltransferase